MPKHDKKKIAIKKANRYKEAQRKARRQARRRRKRTKVKREGMKNLRRQGLIR